MIESIVSFFHKNKKNLIWASLFLFVFFMDFDVSLAAEKSPGQQAMEITNAMLKVIAGIMGIMTAFITLFLQPDWVNGTYIDLDSYMRAIWILMSNIVYVIFAFLLIVIAFANIIGKGQEKFGLKQALPKFIIGILMVPASWFMVQFLISLSGVLTVAALSLPYDTFKDRADEFPVFSLIADPETGRQPLAEAKICTEYVIHFGETPQIIPNGANQGSVAAAQASASNNRKDPIYCKQTDAEKPSVIQILSGEKIGGEESIYSIIALYTFGLLGLESVDNLDSSHVANGGTTTIVAFITKNIVNLIFILVFFLLLIALFFALFMRILRIWIYTMLSPLFGLMFFFGKLGSGGEGLAGRFNIKEFIALIMTPVYVSLALSFGFMFMLVAGSGLQKQTQADPNAEVVPIQIGIIEINITGAINDSGDQQNQGTANHIGAALRSFKGLGGAMGEIVVLLFGIGMLWLAVMAALKQSEITKAAVAPIESFGNQVGKLAASAPQYMPIIPTGKGMTSAAGIGETMNRQFANVKNVKLRQADELGNKFGLGGSETAKIDQKAREATNNIQHKFGKGEPDAEYMKAIEDTIFSASNTSALANSQHSIDLLTQALKDAGIEGKDPRRGDLLSVAEAVHLLDQKLDAGGNVRGNLLGGASREGEVSLSIKELDRRLMEKDRGSTNTGNSSGNLTNDQETTKITNGVNINMLNSIETVDGKVDVAKIDATEQGLLDKLEQKVRKLKTEDQTAEKIRSMLSSDDRFNNADTVTAITNYLNEKIVLNNKSK